MIGALGAGLPYCGAPPSPATLLARWNLDPILIACLAGLLLAYFAIARRAFHVEGRGRWCFVAGWAIGSLALISPLCPLSVSLFSARVGQHMILTFVAAPLIALGLPRRGRTPAWDAPAAAGLFAVLLWVWHAPGPYAATFDSDLVYWLMHLSMIGAALWFWSALFASTAERLSGFVAASALTAAQMSLLGAVITFSSVPLYAPHLLTTWAWGLSPLADQQLGGAIMWAAGGVILVGGLVASFSALMQRAGAPAPRQRLA